MMKTKLNAMEGKYFIDWNIKDFDLEELDYLLEEIAQIYNIKFAENELAHISTFGELFGHIVNKINLKDTHNCTSQQAFYKLKNAFLQVNGHTNITPKTLLTDILPQKNRISQVKELERILGLELCLLQKPPEVAMPLLFIFLISCVFVFFNGKIAFAGFFAFWVGGLLGNKFADELSIKTVGELVTKMTAENYLKVRRDRTTFNKREIPAILSEFFVEKLGLDKSELILKTLSR